MHKEYLKIISQISKNTQIFLSENTTHLEEKNLENVSFQLDWNSQIYKIRSIPSSYEKNPELTLGFILGGSYLGKGIKKILFFSFSTILFILTRYLEVKSQPLPRLLTIVGSPEIMGGVHFTFIKDFL